MSLQDVPVASRKKLEARTLFDNGGECSLVTDSFASKAGFKSTAATYSLAGVGGETVHYSNGHIWEVVLKVKEGRSH